MTDNQLGEILDPVWVEDLGEAYTRIFRALKRGKVFEQMPGFRMDRQRVDGKPMGVPPGAVASARHG